MSKPLLTAPIIIPTNSIYKDFTNLYPTSKTLKFELKPTLVTQNLLDQVGFFDKDITRKSNYKAMKVIFDYLHRDFIADALADVEIDFEEFLTFYREDFIKAREAKKQKTDTTKKEWEKVQKEMTQKLEDYRKIIVIKFNEYGKRFQTNCNRMLLETHKKDVLKKENVDCLMEAGIMEVLPFYLGAMDSVKQEKLFKALNSQDPLDNVNWDITRVKNCIISFKGFFGYFVPFNETRKNLYKDDGTATGIATRLIDDNLVRFCDNILEGYINTGINEYSKTLTQSGIDTYNNQLHLYKQSQSENNELARTKAGTVKKSNFKDLYKVMLSERESFITEYSSNTILTDVLAVMVSKADIEIPKIENLLDNLEQFDLEHIYLKNTSLSEISARYCGGQNWDIIASNIKNSGHEKDKFISLSIIQKSLQDIASGEVVITKKKQGQIRSVEVTTAKNFFKASLFDSILIGEEASLDLWGIFLRLVRSDWHSNLKNYRKYGQLIKAEVLTLDKYDPIKEVATEIDGKNQTQANLVKKYADSILSIWSTIKSFHLEIKNKPDYINHPHDINFYEPIQKFLQDYEVFNYYNDLRNYSTKKPFSTDKFKLNFDNSSLLAGWDMNKEPDNTSILIRNQQLNTYELIILNPNTKGNNRLFEKTPKNPIFDIVNDPDSYQKMEYKLLPGPNKMLPKVAFGASNRKEFQTIFDKYPRIEEIRELKSFTKAKNAEGVPTIQNRDDFKIWINFFTEILHTQKDWKNYNWQFKDASDYGDVSEFYTEVEMQGYKMSFVPVNNIEITKLEAAGKLYRFQIKNKDWNIGSKKEQKSKNLQTLYWEALFAKENFGDSACFKLNGEGEVFKRDKSLESKTRTTVSGKEVIINQRYTVDKLLLHIPITLNFSSQKLLKFNEFMTSRLSKRADEINYLGVDRGENNLLYIVLTNSKGQIILQDNLNYLGGQNYHKLLEDKQNARAQSKETWSTIQNIKELKAGYLSLVVNKICRLAIENNALIVLENLNFGFKKTRTAKFEKSVYQKFETALANKLQNLSFKSKDFDQLGGILNGFQLCPKLDKVGDIEKSSQWGIMQYVPAAYTSKIDPLTGWHQHIYLADKTARSKFNLEADFLDSTSPIKVEWNKKYECYTFEYNHSIIDSKIKKATDTKVWKLYTHKDLIRTTYTNKILQIHTGIEITNNLKEIFKDADNQNLNEYIINDMDDRQLAKLIFNFKLINNIRNKYSVGRLDDGNEVREDVIQSAVLCTPDNCIIYGTSSDYEPMFFNSLKASDIANLLKLRRITDKDGNLVCQLPKDGDANGAYHIAKSGIKFTLV